MHYSGFPHCSSRTLWTLLQSHDALMMRSAHVTYCTTSSLATASRAILERVQPLSWSLTLRADFLAFSVRKLKASTKSSQYTSHMSLTKPLTIFILTCPGPGWSNTQSNSLENETLFEMGCFFVAWVVASSMPSKCWPQTLHCTNR